MDLQMTKDQTYKTCLGEHLLHKKQPYANLSAMTFPPDRVISVRVVTRRFVTRLAHVKSCHHLFDTFTGKCSYKCSLKHNDE